MQTISKITRQLIIENPFYGLYLININKRFSKDTQSACVTLNGINFEILLNPDVWKDASTELRTFLLLHELGHLVFFHIQDLNIWSDKYPDHDLLNISMDCEVNSYIDQKYCDASPDSIANILFKKLPHLKKGMGTSYYYKTLSNLKDHANSAQPNSDNQNQNENQSGDTPTDDFDSLSPEEQTEVMQMLTTGKDIHEMWEKIKEQLGKDNLDKLVRAQSEYITKQAAEQTIKSRGSIPSHLVEMIEKLMKPKPPVFNWKGFFRRKLGVSFDIFQKKSRRKESKRFEDLFGLKLKKKHKILVGIDTSGSINHKDFADFFSELNHVYKAGADIHVLECDADITNEYDYKGKLPDQVTGRGGTSFLPVIDYYNCHPEYNTLVYFTDGYGDQSECKPKNQVLWIITPNGLQDGEYPGIKICIPKREK